MCKNIPCVRAILFYTRVCVCVSGGSSTLLRKILHISFLPPGSEPRALFQAGHQFLSCEWEGHSPVATKRRAKTACTTW